MNKKLNALLFIFASLALAITAQEKQNELGKQLQETIANKNAQIGVAVIIDGKDTITLNNNAYYPMMSVVKFHQALAVAHYLEQKKLPLTTSIPIKKSALHPDTHSPLRDKYPQGDIHISIQDLLIYTLQKSDNNACDILFDYAGGVKQTDNYIRSLGLKDFSITAKEVDMHRDWQVCYQNRTSPLDAARLLDMLITRPLFGDIYQTFIKGTMIECKSGKDRLSKPLLRTKAVIGHKTGTGPRNAKNQLIGTNDIGFVLLPDGRRYTIAVFVKDSEENALSTTQIIAEISGVVYQYICSH